MSFSEYEKMEGVVKAFKAKVGRLPRYYDSKEYGIRILQKEYTRAEQSVKKFKNQKDNPSHRDPRSVTISGDAIPKVTKSADWLRVEAAVGVFNNFLEFYKRIQDENYLCYKNDIYPQGSALDRLKKNLGLNCADFSQVGWFVAVKIFGLEAHFVHVKCKKSGLGHIYLIVKYSGKWIVVDLAAAASSNHAIDTGWCLAAIPKYGITAGNHSIGGNLVSLDDAWLKLDDGKT